MQTYKVMTFGCKANKYDSACLENELESLCGAKEAAKGQAPDFIVVNTCTVTGSSDSQARQLIRRLKRKFPKSMLFVTGCYARISPQDVLEQTPCDDIITSSDAREIAAKIRQTMSGKTVLKNDGSGLYLTKFSSRTRAFLKIQDGCDSFCTYCIIPYARGKPKSEDSQRVLEQIAIFAGSGFKEVVLTGIHLGIYGKDRGEKDGLLNLLKLLEKRSPVRRIRLSSIEPDELTPELISFISSSECVNPHLHLPMQSGSDRILKMMGRRYSMGFYADRVLSVYDSVKSCGIGADVIAGFPGETDQDYYATLKAVKDLPFSYLHVFPFSPRKGTAAYSYGERVGSKITKERCLKLREQGVVKKKAFLNSLLGSFQSVLIENRPDKKTGMPNGFSRNYAPVLIKGGSGDGIFNREIEVQITQIESQKAIAEFK